jgi:hypothetical protein
VFAWLKETMKEFDRLLINFQPNIAQKNSFEKINRVKSLPLMEITLFLEL